MANLIQKEFDSDSFIVDHVIETLTYKATDGKVGQQNFDPSILEGTFLRTIEDLKRINEVTKKKMDSLENDCLKEKQECKDKMMGLENTYNESFDKLCKLDERISEVSTKMSEMGSQLDNLNRPRHNLSESFTLAKYFDKFMNGTYNSGVFADDSKLEQAADVIHKLHTMSYDLTDQKFEQANRKISDKYDEIEKKLIQRFHSAFYSINDKDKNNEGKKMMKKYINILSNFRGYQDCINEFIKNSQLNIQHQKDIFLEIPILSKKMNEIINDVFTNNERIMEQFIKDLFLGKVQNFITQNTKDIKETDLERYLDTIYLYYNKNKKIFKELAELMKLSSESTFFTKLMNEVYQPHLKDYVSLEKINLQNKYKMYLDRFYENLGHTKRSFQTFNFKLSNFLSNNQSNSNSNEVIDERFLDFNTTAVCIDDAKKALNRIQLLCELNHQSKSVEDVCEIISNALVKEHFYYTMDLHIYAIQLNDNKVEPNVHLFKTIKILNELMHLFERFINSNALVLVNGTVNHSRIQSKQKILYNELELKIDTALEKVFTLICSYIKNVLQSEQKASDFKPDEQSLIELQQLTICTPACSKVLKIIGHYIEQINETFDGKNVNLVLKELGIKFHRCVYDHILRYEYNELGAMSLIRDLNEYRRCAKSFNSHLLETLFTTLYSLGNLMVVAPVNLPDICAGEHLSVLNKDVIESFVKLRADNKHIKFQINRPK